MDLCSSKRICLEIGYVFIIEKFQDYNKELATFKNYRAEVGILNKCQMVSQHFAHNSKYSLVTREM